MNSSRIIIIGIYWIHIQYGGLKSLTSTTRFSAPVHGVLAMGCHNHTAVFVYCMPSARFEVWHVDMLKGNLLNHTDRQSMLLCDAVRAITLHSSQMHFNHKHILSFVAYFYRCLEKDWL